MAIRTMYQDLDETLFQASRPIILNGINSVTSEPDLADRSIPVSLATISETDRKTEADVIDRFNKVRPLIFGALCQAVSVALKNIHATKLQRLPRMADFALWATAAEPTYCAPGEFMMAYSGNRQSAIDESLASSSVMDTIFLMTDEPTFVEWEGTPTELLQLLNEKAGDRIQRSKSWPKEPNQLTRLLNKAAPQLRSRGVTFQLSGKHPKTRRKIYTLIKGCENIVRTVRTEENKQQHADIVNEKERTMNLKSSFATDKSSFATDKTSFAGTGGANDVFDPRTMNEGVRTMNEKNIVRDINKVNQDVTSIFPSANDANGVFASFNTDENIVPLTGTPTADGKPKFRMVI